LSIERRKSERLDVALGAKFQLEHINQECLIKSLSEDGCCAVVSFPKSPPPPETQVLLRINLCEGEEPLVAQSRVVWTERVQGTNLYQVGMQLLEFAKPQHFQRLSVFLEKGMVRQEVSRETAASRNNALHLSQMNDLELQRIKFLAELSRFLNRSHEIQEVADAVVSSIAEVMRADKVLLLLDHGGAVPEVLARWGESTESEFSHSVVEKVMRTGRPILSLDVANDVELSTTTSLNLLGTRSILCIPLISGKKRLGLLYLDNAFEKAAFSEQDLEIAKVLADLAASAIERGRYFDMLVQQEKLSALGTMTASLTHELNNPLTAICGAVDLLRDSPEDPETLEILEANVKRCIEMVQSVTNWSRCDTDPATEVSLKEVVDATTPFVQNHLLRTGVKLRIELDQNLPTIKGSASQLSQVLLNILNNAIQAMDRTEDPFISIRGTTTDKEVFLRVKDNGPGIPPENLARIFDPFYTTKPKGKGTGLGLSISRDILSRFGARIEARNLPDGGAQFLIRFPAHNQAVEQRVSVAN